MDYWGIGLNTDEMTWPIYAMLVASWAITLWICTPLQRRGWIAVPSTLFGFVWLGFGVNIVFRFLLLSADSVDFGNHTYRLAVLTPEVLNRCLLCLALFWVCYIGGFLICRRVSFPNPLLHLADFGPSLVRKLFPLTLLLTSACLYLTLRDYLPAAAITPAGLVGSLWVVPASVLWLDLFSNRTKNKISRFHLPLLSLAPGVVAVWLNPYRENLVTVLLVPFIAAVFAGVHVKFVRVAVASLVLLIVTTAIVQLYRRVVWAGDPLKKTRLERLYWEDDPDQAPWMEPLRRFHALDSLLLTISLVPNAISYTGENVFTDAIINGVVPRAIYSNKEADTKGVSFGQTIWGYENRYVESGTPIAPSMPGDLYFAGGIMFIAVGAAIWGAFVGICESWKQALPNRGQIALTAMLALSFAASIERDFVHMVSTTIQQLIVLSVVLAMFGVSRSRGSVRNPERVQMVPGTGKQVSR